MLQNAQKLNKEQIKSIGLDNVLEIEKEEENIEQNEIKERANVASNFYNNYFQKVIKLFLFEQLKYLGTEAENEKQLLYTRGKISGIDLIDMWFKKQVNIKESQKENKPMKFN